ncbi:glycosyltransferase [Singulisphaera sp. PoT]|uniref:glycosyltransferase n=1 Tax=Singulisphaera sp. PoT TaxID=3411797 RepID=UPI003BF51577
MSTTLAICFTNFGPYHLARLRALAVALEEDGGKLLAYEMAGTEKRYPWQPARGDEPFAWSTFFPDQAVERLSGGACSQAIYAALDRDQPSAVAIVGYARPESRAALRWGWKHDVPVILMSESQSIDHPRVWWKEVIKRGRVERCSAGLVGGPRHRDYLVDLGLPADRIALGYNAVDNDHYATLADSARQDPAGRSGLPEASYFIAVNRFVPEKNLPMLVRAYARYRRGLAEGFRPWDLVLCGGGPNADEVEAAIVESGFADSIHRPGFLQADVLPRWYAHASAFVHPSLMEPWGLVVNEAAVCGLPLLVSDLAGAVETFVPEGKDSTGRRFDPRDEDSLAACLEWMATQPEADRLAQGRRAAAVASEWGPERFARGTLEAIAVAARGPSKKRPRYRLLASGS